MCINIEAFLELVRAGLWEKEARLSQFGKVDYENIYRLSEEQTVDGLVAAGFAHVVEMKVPSEIVLTFVGNALQLEQRNQAMNEFIASTVEKMNEAGVKGLLVKGSGLAQCYERPLWRSCGDIDFFFLRSDYRKAIDCLKPMSSEVFQDANFSKSYGLVIDGWMVELQGTLRCGLSSKAVRETDRVQRDVFYGGDVRSWWNGKTQVFMPGINCDLYLLFTHFVRHFYHNEFVLRQICDWCRFLWTYRGQIDVGLLENRLRRSGLITEWKVFADFVVKHLGMPVEAMPLYNQNDNHNLKKTERILDFTLNGTRMSKVKATYTIWKIFPLNTVRFAPAIFFHLNWVKVKERVFG